MQAHGGQLHEVEPAGIHAPLREASAPNDAAAPETRRVTVPPLAPTEQRPSAAPHVTGEAGATAVIEALVLAALRALRIPRMSATQSTGRWFMPAFGDMTL
jgi:hypothetical protein